MVPVEEAPWVPRKIAKKQHGFVFGNDGDEYRTELVMVFSKMVGHAH